MDEKLIDIARQRAIERGHKPEDYDIKVVEAAEVWQVEFVPKAKDRLGGGFRVEITKGDLKVKRVVNYQ